MSRRSIVRLVVVFAAAVSLPSRADVRLPALVGDHMVLQRDREAGIWGWADPGEQVRLQVGDATLAAVTAGADGRWLVKLPARKAGGPVDITITGRNTLKLADVMFGDVWLCSGQSNMQWEVRRAANAEAEAAAADWPRIRLFQVERRPAAAPQGDCAGSWRVCTPQTIGAFSAVGYYFGRELHRTLDVPVGLIHSSWGGTLAEAWTDAATLRSDADFAPILARGEAYPADYPRLQAAYEARLAEWTVAEARAKAVGWPPPRKPVGPPAPAQNPHLPAVLYNGMIHPLTPGAIRGAIWYQGESNATRAYQYRELLPAMIGSWRRAFGQGDFPFLIVQLADFQPIKDQPAESDWAELREAQAMTAARVPNCGLAVTIDLGEAGDIHPRNKQDVGRRLALGALRLAYGRTDVVDCGPCYDSLRIEGDKARLRFRHVSSGLVAAAPPGAGGPADGAVRGFTIAGAYRVFVPAEARIEGDAVVVRSPRVAQPVAVRYAWADNPVCNLYNRDGLPAVPFRTDDWPGVTVDAR